jgi:predicted Zn-dependent protease
LTLFWIVPTPLARAQVRPSVTPGRIPLTDPDEFFDRFLGSDTEDDREELKKVEISRREETRAGAAALESFLAQLKHQGISVEKRGSNVQYVERLVAELRPLMKNARRYPKIQVWVADTDETDAKSFPGGSVIISRGLIDYCESEAALVGILGHELAHIDRGHQLNHLRRWKLAQKSFTSGFDLNRMLAASSMMAKMFMRPFQPEEESEADQDGARWAFQLGYDPMELALVFLSLHERDGRQPNFVPSFLRSHPFHVDRYRAMLKQSQTMKLQNPEVDLYIGRKNLQKQISRSERAFPE